VSATRAQASPFRIWRRRLIALALVALALVAGYWFWLRDSSLVAVENVEVKGATVNSEEISAALEPVAMEMTTLNVDDDELVRAVLAFPTVASIAADASIPHKLTITVTERLPVAVFRSGGEATAVSIDGYLLPGVDVQGEGLPQIEGAEVSAGRLEGEGAAQAAIVGAAPSELRDRIEAVSWDSSRGGVVVELDGAPEARFGDGADGDLKWEALAAVLLDPEAGGSSYIDVSVPERAVSGG
jgi:cell division protein FtsQ